ncbi:uncharacterized protein LOC117644992, partial [Thrips palmi]|uniref:Uncharacterized protein LOC117644992 n=1 Tax=Thrips palmi TaxID=161013 RepID=A0A6P8YLG9_THRPL
MALREVLLVALATLLLRHARSQTSNGEQVVSRDGEDCLSQYAAPATVLAVPEEVVLVLGNSGSGKSALAKHLSRHDGDMKAVRENGEFFIEGDGIGGSIASVTSVPELFHDNETATNYFDCPGFEDTRGPCSEVTTTYYMKDIARHARRVKVLLLAPHFAVRKGQDRSDFLTMLRHAARVLKDPAKLQQSLALVVTKVEAPVVKRNNYDGYGRVSSDLVKAPDSDVRSGVEAFLSREVRPFLAAMAEDSSVQQEERTELRNAVKIVDILLLGGVETRRHGRVSRIGLFHAPDEVGALGDIEIMRNGRAELLELVQGLGYADVQQGDFGFSVSARTKVFALRRVQQLNEDVVAALGVLGQAAKNQSASAYDPSDIRASQERYAELEKKAADVARHLKNSTDVKEFCLRVAVPEDSSVQLADKCAILDVLQVVSEQPVVDHAVLATTWAAPMDSVTEYLKEKKEWHSFLLSLYQRFNSYPVQLQRRSSSTPFPSSSFVELPEFAAEAEALAAFAATGQNLSDVAAVVSTASRGPKTRCVGDLPSGGHAVVEGETVLLSEAVAAARNSCAGPLQLLEVYALNTVFVDDTVRLPSVPLVVAAPRWETLGSPTINLDGEDGEPLGSAPAANCSGERGHDGRPGNPGGPGGVLLAVGMDFAGNKVRVSAKGGAGGVGEEGGAGSGGGGDGGAGGL